METDRVSQAPTKQWRRAKPIRSRPQQHLLMPTIGLDGGSDPTPYTRLQQMIICRGTRSIDWQASYVDLMSCTQKLQLEPTQKGKGASMDAG